jgi:hypothetical protein
VPRTSIARLLFIMGLSLFVSCRGTKNLTEGQYLFAGHHLNFDSKKKIHELAKKREELENKTVPKANNTFLGMRPAVAIFNTIGEPKREKGLKFWLKYKVGKKPVLLSQVDPGSNLRMMRHYLFNHGYFESDGEYEVNQHGKTASIHYKLHPGPAYKIDTVFLPDGNSPVARDIHSLGMGRYFEDTPIYDLDRLTSEIEQVHNGLKDLGYYKFNPDYLIFRADTTVGDHRARMHLEIRPDIPPIAEKKYRLSSISVYDDYSLVDYQPDTALIHGIQYMSENHAVRPELVIDMLQIHRDSLYSMSATSNTLRTMGSIDYFRSANIRYSEMDSTAGTLHADLYLRESKNLALTAEINTIAKSNNFAGPGVRLGIKKRNLFGGMESISWNFSGRFETQVAGDNKGNTAFEINSDLTLSIPRLVPFRFAKKTMPYVPTTRIQTGGGIFQRTNLYQFNTTYLSIAYLWRKGKIFAHELKLPDISFTRLANSSDEFSDFLNQNPSLKKSFEEQFIIGPSYYISIDKLAEAYPTRYFAGFGVESSATAPILAMRIFRKEPPHPDNPYKLLNNTLSQFLRFRLENRFHIRTGLHSIVATRIFAGVGIPFGNSNSIPYVKQFFVGGTNSLRGFTARSVGPGTYAPPEEQTALLVDQTGEIKIEANAEYRFPIKGVMKGAVFLDAGNVWLVNDDSVRVGGNFSADRFYKELAINTGIGLRIDANILVVRFDVGMPLRKPWLPEGSRWVVRDINFSNRDWRRENLILNISIGYPF